jgi:ATP-dependent exoDNAse (exonuclease V) alpha subunit
LQYLNMLDILRTSMPTELQLNQICRNHKAWEGDEPDAKDIGRLLRTHPEAVMVAATRAGVAQVNRLALEALHPRAQPLAVLPAAIEENPDNYYNGKLREDRRPQPSEVPIHRGLKIYLTRNVRKADDFINGMLCEVLSYDDAAGALWVRTQTGKRLPITQWSDPDHPGLRFFPIRLGYCTTIHKVQGDEFPFIIIYLDAANMPAVGYTAMSRVKDGKSYLLGGQLTPEHFVPVTMR